MNYVRGFPRGHWSFLGHGSEKKWYGTYSGKFDGVSDKTAEDMMLGFAETINPMFRASSALERGELRCKGVGKQTIHFNGSEQNVELFLRTIISANQFRIFGAVVDMCREVSKDTMTSGNLKHMIIWRRWKFQLKLLLLTLVQMNSGRETCCKTMSVNSNNYLTIRSYTLV